jgi:hypothetical protein
MRPFWTYPADILRPTRPEKRGVQIGRIADAWAAACRGAMAAQGQSSTFVDRRCIGRSAPIPAVRGTEIERQGTTLLGHSASHSEQLFLPQSGQAAPPGSASTNTALT